MNLSIIGLGLYPKMDLSLEAVSKIESADTLILVSSSGKHMQKAGCFLGKNIVNLSHHLFSEGDSDEDTYTGLYDSIKTIILNSLSGHSICILVDGNPMFGMSFVHHIVPKLESLGPLQIIAGLSSFSKLAEQCSLQSGQRGYQLFKANRFVLFNQRANPAMTAFYFNIGLVASGKNGAEKWRIFVGHLQKFYSISTKIMSVEMIENIPLVSRLPLSELLLERCTFQSTLVIEAV